MVTGRPCSAANALNESSAAACATALRAVADVATSRSPGSIQCGAAALLLPPPSRPPPAWPFGSRAARPCPSARGVRGGRLPRTCGDAGYCRPSPCGYAALGNHEDMSGLPFTHPPMGSSTFRRLARWPSSSARYDFVTAPVSKARHAVAVADLVRPTKSTPLVA